MESKIGKTLSERTTKVVIILVLVMLFIMPVFSIDTYGLEATTIHESGLKLIKHMYNKDNGDNYSTAVAKYIEETRDLGFSVIYLEVPDYPLFE